MQPSSAKQSVSSLREVIDEQICQNMAEAEWDLACPDNSPSHFLLAEKIEADKRDMMIAMRLCIPYHITFFSLSFEFRLNPVCSGFKHNLIASITPDRLL